MWNFEINEHNSLTVSALPKDSKDELKWEARFFWPGEQIITLQGLDEKLLDIGNYQVKHRQDVYFLLPDQHYNIKRRRNELIYKPLLREGRQSQGYGKKIKLAEHPDKQPLPGTPSLTREQLLSHLQKKGVEIAVDKCALIYKFPSTPAVKLELARLQIANKIYFSACIEGWSQQLVEQITKHLLASQVSCNYVNFLKQTFTS
ncbi:hypothetical protein [Legionella sp. W10-070]|uniref:hypothetical protein n=1 Tax=unclassified Legionella TaxID=2622702 RepID=UPI001F5F7833|nr:hypothetical protein [Legionella sp. W10-070]MDI9819364.1 hypothetical protein [Legionella sp. PL877]